MDMRFCGIDHFTDRQHSTFHSLTDYSVSINNLSGDSSLRIRALSNSNGTEILWKRDEEGFFTDYSKTAP